MTSMCICTVIDAAMRVRNRMSASPPPRVNDPYVVNSTGSKRLDHMHASTTANHGTFFFLLTYGCMSTAGSSRLPDRRTSKSNDDGTKESVQIVVVILHGLIIGERIG